MTMLVYADISAYVQRNTLSLVRHHEVHLLLEFRQMTLNALCLDLDKLP